MEIFQELFLSVVISLGLAFLIAKLVSVASAGSEEHEALLRSEKKLKEKEKEIEGFDGGVVKEVKSFVGELRSKGLEIEKKIEFAEELVIVEEIEGDLVKEGSSEIVQKDEEIVHGGDEIFNEGSELVEVGKIKQKDEEIVHGGHEILNEGSELVEVSQIEQKDQERKEEEEQGGEEEKEQEVKVDVLEEKSIKESSCGKEDEVKTSIFTEDGGQEENLVVERPEKVEVHEIATELAKEEQIIPQEEHIGVIEHENNKEIEIGTEKSGTECLFSDEEDWEGIERSEIENIFGAASAFSGSGDNNELLSKLSSDVQMQLYGLHKVATEGPCYEPQPLALMVSARAKWHAWQRLGNISPEVAMEQYTALLSENIPGWTGRNAVGEIKQDKSNDSPEAEVSGLNDHNLSSVLQHQLVSEDERKPGDRLFSERRR